MEYNIISADGHIDLRYMPGDTFVARAPAKWKEQVPHIIDTPDGPRWYAEGRDLASLSLGSQANMVRPKHGVWPDSRAVIEHDLGGLSPEVRQKITRENAGKLHGLL